MSIKLRNMTAIYLLYGEKILFLYRIGSRVANNLYVGTAGGHFEHEELNDPMSCVLRELYEETGLVKDDIENLELRYITCRLKNNEVRQNYYFFADLLSMEKKLSSAEGNLEWVDLKKAVLLPMPCSAKHVVEHFVSIGRNTDCLYAGVTTDNGIDFKELHEF
ncbi:MAG: NUDIX domain-containing protein [Clostridiales bacterium]|jgi:8-oxo-dGTP diphosphatase|nr:NUDIX domain-containing protein [Clostridiales bacterium]